MGVVIESEIWEPDQSLHIFLFLATLLSIFSLPYFSSGRSASTTAFDHPLPPSLLRFQRSFLLLFSLSSVMEGLWSVFGEYELAHNGISREQILFSLCVGFAAALLIGPFLGMLSDLMFWVELKLAMIELEL